MLRMVGLLSLAALAGGCASTKTAEPPPLASQPAVMHVVQLKYAAAAELERELTQALGAFEHQGLKVVADARTNSLILVCRSEEGLASVLELIARLDVDSAKPR